MTKKNINHMTVLAEAILVVPSVESSQCLIYHGFLHYKDVCYVAISLLHDYMILS